MVDLRTDVERMVDPFWRIWLGRVIRIDNPYYAILLLVALVVGCSPPPQHDPAVPPKPGPTNPAVSPMPNPGPNVSPVPMPSPGPVTPMVVPSPGTPVSLGGRPLTHWVAMMGADDDRTRSEAAARLEELGDKVSASVLPLLGDASVEVRRGAAFVLLGDYTPDNAELTTAFKQRLGDSDARVRHIALQVIAKLELPGIVESTGVLVKMLGAPTETEANRSAIARLLGRLDPPQPAAFAALSACAQTDKDEKVRTACVHSLVKVGTSAEIVPVLVTVLRKDASPANRRIAAAKLGVIGPAAASATGELTAATADSDKEVAAAAKEALVRIGAKPM